MSNWLWLVPALVVVGLACLAYSYVVLVRKSNDVFRQLYRSDVFSTSGWLCLAIGYAALFFYYTTHNHPWAALLQYVLYLGSLIVAAVRIRDTARSRREMLEHYARLDEMNKINDKINELLTR